MARRNGEAAAGPSELYLRLLKGEITAKEYVAAVKQSVNRELGVRPSRAGRSRRALAA